MARPRSTPSTKEDPAAKAARVAANRQLPPGQRLAKDGKPYGSRTRMFDDEPVVDWTNWRQRMRTKDLKLDDRQKARFFEYFAESGQLFNSAYRIDVCVQCIKNHIKADPEFAEAFEDAKARYRDKIERVAELVAQEGVLEPLIGGKNKDRVVATKRVYATNILAMQLKRTNPEYRDQQAVELTVKGGALIAPAAMTPEAWAAQFAAKDAPESGNG